MFSEFQRNVKRIHGWLVAACVLLCSFGSVADESHPLRIITVDEAPANYVEHGQIKGYVTDLVRAILQELQLTPLIEVLPEDQALHIASTRPNVVLFTFSRTAEREQHYIWLMPVLRKRWQLFMPVKRVHDIRTLEDLPALDKIGVVRGDIRERFLRQQKLTNLVSTSSPAQALGLLQKQQLDAVATSQMEIDMLWSQQDFPGVKPAAALSFGYSDAYLLLSNGSDPEMVEQWQKAISQLRQQGTFHKIALTWQDKLTQYSGQTPRLLPGDWLEY